MEEVDLKSPQARPEPIIYDRDQHEISRKNIDPDALKIMYRLIRSGYKAFLVGGGVRDLLLNKTPKDFDISTDATPRKIKYLFRNSRIIGRRFKLVHLYFKGNKIIEVSTFRDSSEPEEVLEEDSSEATNIKSLASDNVYGDETTDAIRRDLTINGLFYDLATFSVIDYVGGMQDLRNGVIRIIGNPDIRFKEDPIRMLRAIRHAARADFEIDSECWASILRNRELILESPKVRVFDELKKDLIGGHFLKILTYLSDSTLLPLILPEISNVAVQAFSLRGVFSKTLKAADDYVLEGNELSVTCLLSIIVILMNQHVLDSNEILPQFFDYDKVLDLIKDNFANFAVPRKEKERIQDLVVSWLEISQADLARVKPTTLLRKSIFNDLKTLYRILPQTDHSRDISNFLEEISKNKIAISKKTSEDSKNFRRGRQKSTMAMGFRKK